MRRRGRGDRRTGEGDRRAEVECDGEPSVTVRGSPVRGGGARGPAERVELRGGAGGTHGAAAERRGGATVERRRGPSGQWKESGHPSGKRLLFFLVVLAPQIQWII